MSSIAVRDDLLSEDSAQKRVLNAGCGPRSPRAVHRIFQTQKWQEIRLDIDSDVGPDIVGSVTDLKAIIEDSSLDAVWCSHTLEHLYAHEVPAALAEFHRVLRADGFALITTPDLEAAAQFILDNGLETVAYIAPAGPITVLEIIYGHSASLARGNIFMAHNTGYTCNRLGRLILDAGFAEAIIGNEGFNIWALALMPKALRSRLVNELHACGMHFSE